MEIQTLIPETETKYRILGPTFCHSRLFDQHHKPTAPAKTTMVSNRESEYTTSSTETVYHIARDVVGLLRQSGSTLAVSESLTGGGVMAALTSVEGCSSVFRGGVVSYATPLKQHLLNVDRDLISEHGVIHAQVAAQMAAGARTITTQEDMTPTSWGIGTTGVAGPDPQDGKPVGMVYIGVSTGSGSTGHGPFYFPGSRERVREATVIEALSLLRQQLRMTEKEQV